ncbi:MAG: hypothetical protein ACXVZX_06740 [Terriglobales bacterium]
MRMRSIGTSLLLAFVGTGLVSFVLMMGIIPALAVMQRLSGNVAQQSVVVNPAAFMRTYGIGLAAVSFVVFFLVSMLRFRRLEHAASARH